MSGSQSASSPPSVKGEITDPAIKREAPDVNEQTDCLRKVPLHASTALIGDMSRDQAPAEASLTQQQVLKPKFKTELTDTVEVTHGSHSEVKRESRAEEFKSGDDYITFLRSYSPTESDTPEDAYWWSAGQKGLRLLESDGSVIPPSWLCDAETLRIQLAAYYQRASSGISGGQWLPLGSPGDVSAANDTSSFKRP